MITVTSVGIQKTNKCPDCGGSGKHSVGTFAWDALGNCCLCKGTGVQLETKNPYIFPNNVTKMSDKK